MVTEPQSHHYGLGLRKLRVATAPDMAEGVGSSCQECRP